MGTKRRYESATTRYVMTQKSAVLNAGSIVCYVSVNGKTYSRILNEVLKYYLDQCFSTSGSGPVPDPGPRGVLLEFVILFF